MGTLKISDLSVGDWVKVRLNKCDYDEPDTFMAKVLSVVNNSVGVGYDNSGIVMSALVEDLQPIPITAEKLEKNGWRVLEKEVLGEDYEYNGGERVWDDENCTIEICEEKQEVFWYSWSKEYYMWRLEYVHQLQHLIRLAGVEKEINL